MNLQRRTGTVGLLAWGMAAAILLGCGGSAATKQSAEMDVRDQARLAQSLMSAGRVGDALAVINEALRSEPENAQLHSFHGKINFQAGKYDEAEQSFRRALELDPYLTDAHNFLGAVYTELGRLAEAETEFGIALDDPAYPTPEQVYLNRGLLYASQGRTEEAIADLRRAVELNPKFYRGHFELASALDRLGKIEEAAREYEVATPGYRNVGELHYRLGFAYFRLGQVMQARESLNRAIAVAPGSPSAAQADDLLQVIAESSGR